MTEVLLRHPAQSRLKPLTERLGTIEQSILLEGLEGREGREGRGATDGIAAVGAVKIAGQESIHDLGAADDAGEWKAAGRALGDRHQIGLDAEVLEAEELAGPSEAALDFRWL
ncbi:hypothetical protein QA641_31665 [Bradyrhizobium sp. CB1650]|uniref:hypothetical protein n=1 Tax=Bradyrhizobium sp. CB1650 TaxID=3039153 RepID=UPI0024352872|nr:hypothetical protein [Bradyrhizobium sp. CB1650]WGD50145.1 hypothetical protein QA641_31665 [Bradyrhizobium sp. CB1650]